MKKIILVLLCICLVQFAQSQIPSYVPKDSLVGWWPFNGNANDESGNGNDGTVNGATLSSDRIGSLNSAYEFNGISDFMAINNLSNYKYKPFTVSCWVNSYSLDTVNSDGGRVIIGREEYGTYYNGSLMLYNYQIGSIYNNLAYYTGNKCYYSNFNFSINNWVNVAYTLNNDDSIIFYVNGKEISKSKIISSSYWHTPFLIGAGNGPNKVGNRFFWHGKIDDIGVWGRVLDSTEIQNLYNSNTAGFKNYQINKRIKLYPNPVRNMIKIEGYAGNSMIQIFDISGQKVIDIPFTKQIDIQELKNGLYFLKLENTQLKFIKE